MALLCPAVGRAALLIKPCGRVDPLGPAEPTTAPKMSSLLHHRVMPTPAHTAFQAAARQPSRGQRWHFLIQVHLQSFPKAVFGVFAQGLGGPRSCSPLPSTVPLGIQGGWTAMSPEPSELENWQKILMSSLRPAHLPLQKGREVCSSCLTCSR